MRIFVMMAIAAIVVAIGYEAGHAYFTRSQGTASTATMRRQCCGQPEGAE